MKKFHPKAFSIVELAIVLIIVGVMIGGIMNGASIVRTARVIGARSATSKAPVPKIEGLVAWYETSTNNSFLRAQLINGTQLTSWFDINPSSIAQQRNTLTRTASTAVTYQIEAINDIPSVQFNGSGAFTLNSTLFQSSSAQATIFLVFQPLATLDSTARVLLDSFSSGTNNSIGIKSNAVTLNAGSAADTGATNPASFSSGSAYVAAIYFNGTASGVYVNDTATLIGNGNINPGSNSLSGLTVGMNRSLANGFNGYISEIIIYNRPLKRQERKDVMAYLAKKYRVVVTNL